MNNMSKNILVIGGGGYVGTVLVKRLLKQNFKVKVYDLYLYGNHFEKKIINNKDFSSIIGDIRDIKKLDQHIKDCNIVIHLACISNDPSAELDMQLTKSVNYDAFLPILESCKKNKIERIVNKVQKKICVKREPILIEYTEKLIAYDKGISRRVKQQKGQVGFQGTDVKKRVNVDLKD